MLDLDWLKDCITSEKLLILEDQRVQSYVFLPSIPLLLSFTVNCSLIISSTIPPCSCRLAMLGFVAALGAELSTGDTVLKQLSVEPTGIILTFITFAAASLVS